MEKKGREWKGMGRKWKRRTDEKSGENTKREERRVVHTIKGEEAGEPLVTFKYTLFIMTFISLLMASEGFRLIKKMKTRNSF